MKWYEIEPADAVDIDCTKRPDLGPPRNEVEEVCPWPWEPQTLVGVPMGQYHCPYCGAMCVAGVRHLDYTGFEEQFDAFMKAGWEREQRLHMHATLYGEPAAAARTAPVETEDNWWAEAPPA